MEPLFWDPVIVAGYTRMMAHEMSGSWKPEIVFGAIAEYFGEGKLLELIPGGEYDIPSIAKISNQGMTPFTREVLGQGNVVKNLLGDFPVQI